MSVFAAAAPNNAVLEPQDSSDKFLAAVNYEGVTSVVTQCDVASTSTTFQ